MHDEGVEEPLLRQQMTVPIEPPKGQTSIQTSSHIRMISMRKLELLSKNQYFTIQLDLGKKTCSIRYTRYLCISFGTSRK